ncbi:dephospho-CoA kinase [Vandammella animalimorsus]|uniref:Dephospho-CoA kinase n=1 Tax=Vandammella animalimorsus TaxID=2029117 RepID=A0A3M6R994_9BURK|nr:dephospho-CoA kinase [Vandammella animalimorsus]RMX11912.1 dephospho-CoA kinase [Vandammella animalimorsus]
MHCEPESKPPRLIGLSGGIGSGKSTVAALWQELFHVPVADADGISRQLTQPGGAAVAAIGQHFGAEYVGADGAMDRARMRQRVFADAQAKKALEAILHPLIFQALQDLMQQAQARRQTAIVLDIPLLVESAHWRPRLDAVVIVDCSAELQLQRVMQRSQLPAQEVQRILGQQAPRRAKLAAADLVIANGDISLAQLRAQAQRAGDLLQLEQRR